MHEGEVSALLGTGGDPVGLASRRWWRATAALAGYEDGRIHVQHVSARETVEAIERAKAAGVAGDLPRPRPTTCC